MPQLRSLKVTLIRHGESQDNSDGICEYWLPALLIRRSPSLVLSTVPFLSSNLFSFSCYLDTLIQSGAGFKDSPLTSLGLAVSSSRAAIADYQINTSNPFSCLFRSRSTLNSKPKLWGKASLMYLWLESIARISRELL